MLHFTEGMKLQFSYFKRLHIFFTDSLFARLSSLILVFENMKIDFFFLALTVGLKERDVGASVSHRNIGLGYCVVSAVFSNDDIGSEDFVCCGSFFFLLLPLL